MAPVCFHGLLVILLSAFVGAQVSYLVNPPPPPPGYNRCCYGRTTFLNGQTVTTLPECCVSLVCDNGNIEPRHFSKPGSSGCCEFDGQMYPEGAELSSYCVSLVCRRGNWTYSHKIEECCKLCKVYDDPHFSTFDGYRYHWHGTCNYTITQTGNSHYPDIGVFSDFRPCFGPSTTASCLHRTTFRNDKHTVITLDHTDSSLFSFAVNGHPFFVPASGVHPVRSSVTHPVLSWRDGSCVFLAGSSRILLRYCHHQLYVWAYPAHTNQLDGLCGHFNFYQNDDMTSRDGTVHPLHPWPEAFPESWKTNDQTDRKCLAPCLYCKETTTDPCRASARDMDALKARCSALLHFVLGRNLNLLHHVDTCAWDLCMARQAGQPSTELERWLFEVLKMVTDSRLMEEKTTGTFTLQLPPTTGVCTPGSRWKRTCNWCTCGPGGTADCSRRLCPAGYQHPAGEDACADNSVWMADDCNWCHCITGGHICTYENCTGGTSVPTLPSAPTLPTEQVCFYTHDAGSCHDNQQRYYYNYFYGRCTTFSYTGCGGNANNFQSEAECLTVCGHLTATTQATTATPHTPTRPPQCNLQPNSGPCHAAFSHFFYNATTDTCEPFTYGGCKGNGNNFDSKDTCVAFCGASTQVTIFPPTSYQPGPLPPRCVLVPQPGNCAHALARYFYSRSDGACLQFVYSGCGGNENNFQTKESCESICLGGSTPSTASTTYPFTSGTDRPLHCSLHPEAGPCYNFTDRFYYDPGTETCRTFRYGGCGGNNNNFLSKDWCLASCALTASTTETVSTDFPIKCYQDTEVGDCFETLWRWHYKSSSHSCEVFLYGGCGGNDNNFITKEDCEAACGGQTQSTTEVTPDGSLPCHLAKDHGPCSYKLKRYYYNGETRQCEEFTYSGCGGNKNNFNSLTECWTTCG
ncbi:papilin-like isoform X2 [Eriocheir sinensis]|uniref:papilin-like isoform X2 n=1 Tax=Eriocheir sinensis TaxID=95602 RepID=UPI0021C961ED|nr:papilin-like isoform X2 [Eriocheir sinensis]